MTTSDLQFRTWLMAQPDDRVFSVDVCNCPLACFAKEVLGFEKPAPGYSIVSDGNGPVTTIESARRAVNRMGRSYIETITAQQFRQLYEESNQ